MNDKHLSSQSHFTFILFFLITPYKERPPGSLSKLHTIRDGLRILRTIFSLYVYVRPLAVFGSLFFMLSLMKS